MTGGYRKKRRFRHRHRQTQTKTDTEGRPSEDTERRWPSTTQEEWPQNKPILRQLNLRLLAPRIMKNKFLLFKALALGYFVITALAN